MAFPLARNRDPQTSHDAADALAADVLTRQQAAILDLLRESPAGLTDRELTAKYFAVADRRGWPITEFDSIRKRRSTLTTRGLVVGTTVKRDPRTNRDAAIWRVIER